MLYITYVCSVMRVVRCSMYSVRVYIHAIYAVACCQSTTPLSPVNSIVVYEYM